MDSRRPWSHHFNAPILARLSVAHMMVECPLQRFPFHVDVLSVPEWALPALQAGSQNSINLFNLAQRMRSGGPVIDEGLQILKNAKCSWNIPNSLFIEWLHQGLRWKHQGNYIPSETSPGRISCCLLKARDLHNGIVTFHLLPFIEMGFIGITALAFGNPDQIDETIFALESREKVFGKEGMGTNKAASTSPEQSFFVGGNTQIPQEILMRFPPEIRRVPPPSPPSSLERYPSTVDDIIDARSLMSELNKMWGTLDLILNVSSKHGTLDLSLTRCGPVMNREYCF